MSAERNVDYIRSYKYERKTCDISATSTRRDVCGYYYYDYLRTLWLSVFSALIRPKSRRRFYDFRIRVPAIDSGGPVFFVHFRIGNRTNGIVRLRIQFECLLISSPSGVHKSFKGSPVHYHRVLLRSRQSTFSGPSAKSLFLCFPF